jgi:hypothetical protein
MLFLQLMDDYDVNMLFAGERAMHKVAQLSLVALLCGSPLVRFCTCSIDVSL